MTEKITITELTTDGNGLAEWIRHDEELCKVEVPFSLPEDVLEVELKKGRKKKRYSGSIVRIEKPSPIRREARCVHFASCGGCTFQHMPYEMQLKRKEGLIRSQFERFFTKETQIHPIIGSPEWGYRNKMEFSFSQDKKGEKYLGLILKDSGGKVFNLTECHLVDPWFHKTLAGVRAWWQSSTLQAYHPPTNRGSLRTATFRHSLSTGDKMVMLTVSGNPDFAIKRKELDSFVQAIKDTLSDEQRLSIVLRIQQLIKGEPTQFYEMILFGPDHIRENLTILGNTFEFHISPQAFFQPNSKLVNTLYSKALELAEISEFDVVYDLYCGAGIFGMCASKLAKEVHAIELSPEGAYDAKTNRDRLGFFNFSIYQGDCGKVLEENKAKLPAPDIVIVDPPRSGLDPKAVQQIIDLAPQTIVYVSCNPTTQVLNVEEFVKVGYVLKHIQPLDQFPQTAHVENICILAKHG